MFVAAAFFAAVPVVRAQAPAGAPQAAPRPGVALTVCGSEVPVPTSLPPEGSGPVFWLVAPCFEGQGNVSIVDVQTYLYYIESRNRTSRPSQGQWTPYDENIEKVIKDDFQRLWGLKFLDNLSIEKIDYKFANGVIGEIVVYNLEERQRIKIYDFVGSKKITSSDIETKLRERSVQIRADTFIDQAQVQKARDVVRDMLKDKGFQNAEVTTDIKELPGGPKLIHLTFNMNEGPKVKIRKIDFVGNQAASDRALKKRMKDNKELWFLSFISGRGTYTESKFEEDADRVMQWYLDRGYITAQIGAPEVKVVGDSSDKKTRYIQLNIPVTEGNRYRVGNFDFAGNSVVKSEGLQPLFKIKAGDYYSQKEVRKGFEKAREAYGQLGYMEFTGYPDNRPRDLPNPADAQAPAALAAVEESKPKGPPVVDVTMRIVEGKQYYVNRITFMGNTTTRDNVIRREMRLLENGIFNSEALKYSIRRLNQLGYFKALEGPPKDVTIDKTANADGKVDVNMKLEEQNRNQLSFGAGVSQFEGFFGQLSFQTSNFLGRGESLTLSLQAGSRAHNYTLAFTEPFLFDRNITGGLNLNKTEIRYINQFTQQSTGGSASFGFPLGRGFTRMFTSYSYEQVRVTELNAQFNDPLVLQRNPFLRDSLLIGVGGERVISEVTPSIIYNTVDQPIFPTTGKRLTASFELAGFGGNTNFYQPTLEGVWILRQNNRMSLAMRGQLQYIKAFSGTTLPIFKKLFLGGEYSVRGFDIRSIGPRDPVTGLVLGGDKSLLFNLEQNINIAGPVRLIAFFDAGQVRDVGQAFSWHENLIRIVPTKDFILSDPYSLFTLTDPTKPLANVTTEIYARAAAFKTSTGLEVRFFMPVLNVPFRLIFAENLSRAGVLDNSLQPQSKFQFRFAVGTTF